MCEILICVHDRSNTGILAYDAVAPMQGDVITVVADGWEWSELELGSSTWFNYVTQQRESVLTHPNGNHKFFRIIKLPNVSLAAASTMLNRELPIDPLNPSPFLRYRGRFLNKAKIPPATMQNLIDHWNDDLRTQGFISLNFTAAQINSIVSTTDDVDAGNHARVPWP